MPDQALSQLLRATCGKDASRSLNREGTNRAWVLIGLVFEVKYFKYTLFVLVLPSRILWDNRPRFVHQTQFHD
jgi:hypothetical protein